MNTHHTEHFATRNLLNVRRSARLGALLLIGGAALLGAWSALAPLSSAVITEGVFAVEHNRKLVQHKEGGIVREILVHEGDRVAKGQPLLVLADEKPPAELANAQAELEVEWARSARLDAERQGTSSIAFPADLLARAGEARVRALMEMERAQFEARGLALRDQLSMLSDQIGDVEKERAALERQHGADTAAAGKMAEELEANERLQAEGFISRAQVLRIQRGADEYTSRLGATAAAMARASQRAKELQMRATSLRNQLRQDASAQYVVSQARVAELENRLAPLRDAVSRQVISAPAAGTVVDLKVFTVGGVIAPGQVLLEVVPDNAPLIVQTRLQLDDIRHVRAGTSADVRLPAYDARKTPLAHGEVVYVSADRLIDERGGASYYLAHVRVDARTVDGAAGVNLKPGMRAEVFLHTGERTALDYLLAPVTSTLARAARES